MTKSMQQAILDAGDRVPADEPDSEKPDTMDPDDYVLLDAQSQSGSRAKSEASTEIDVCEAPSFSHRRGAVVKYKDSLDDLELL